jgi:hypothetical protein
MVFTFFIGISLLYFMVTPGNLNYFSDMGDWFNALLVLIGALAIAFWNSEADLAIREKLGLPLNSKIVSQHNTKVESNIAPLISETKLQQVDFNPIPRQMMALNLFVDLLKPSHWQSFGKRSAIAAEI